MAKHYTCDGLTGGTGGKLDFLWANDDLVSGATLETGDICSVLGYDNDFVYSAASVATPAPPNVIKAVSNTGTGRWLLNVDNELVVVHTTGTAIENHKTNAVKSANPTVHDMPPATVGGKTEIMKEGVGGITLNAQPGEYVADSNAGGAIVNNSTFAFGSIKFKCVILGKWSLAGAPLGEWTT